MNARNLLNLALLIIVGLLVAVVVFEPGKEPPPEPVKLTSLDENAVSRIQITRKDKDTIELEKRDGHWQMRAPFELPASDYKVESVLKLLQTESAAQYDMARRDPARFGLAPPAVSVRFDDRQIDFGDTEPLQHQRYARIGQTLHLIPDYYYYQLAGSSTDYLDHGLFPAEAKITRLELPGLTLQLKDGKWQAQPPAEGYSADAFTALFDEWRHARAIELRPLKDTAQAKGKPVRVFLRDRQQPVEYRLQQTDDELLLHRPDKQITYVLPADKADTLLRLQKKAQTDKSEAAPESEPESEQEPKPAPADA